MARKIYNRKLKYILSLSHSGSTMYGKSICKENDLFIGESIRKFFPIYEFTTKQSNFCSCGSNNNCCPFWSNINKFDDVFKNFHDYIIIDSSKSLEYLKLIEPFFKEVEVHLIIRNPFTWVKSIQNNNGKSNIVKLLIIWLLKNIKFLFGTINYKRRIVWMKKFDNTNKGFQHIYASNENKFTFG